MINKKELVKLIMDTLYTNRVYADHLADEILKMIEDGEFEKDIFKVINNHCERGLKKEELVRKMEWITGNCKMS